MSVSATEIGGKLQIPQGWAISGELPLVVWDHRNKRIDSIEGKMQIKEEQIQIRCRRLGESEYRIKTYYVQGDGVISYVSTSGIHKERQKVRLIRDHWLRGPVAYYFGVQGVRTNFFALGGHLSKDIADRFNNQGRRFFTVVIDENSSTIARFEQLDCFREIGQLKAGETLEFQMKLFFKGSKSTDYHTYKVTPKVVGDNVVGYTFDDTETVRDNVHRATGQSNPIIDRLEKYAELRFVPQENPETKFLTIGYSSKQGALGVDDRVPEFNLRSRIFPICIEEIEDPSKKIVRIVQVELREAKNNYGLRVKVTDVTDYTSDRDKLSCFALSEGLLEQYMQEKYLALLERNQEI